MRGEGRECFLPLTFGHVGVIARAGSSAAVSSNSVGEILSDRRTSSSATLSRSGLVGVYSNGAPETLHTHSVHMNLSSGGRTRRSLKSAVALKRGARLRKPCFGIGNTNN